MNIDFTEILVETVRQILILEGKDADDDELVESFLNQLFTNSEYIDCISRCITMNAPFTNFETYQMTKRK